MNVVSEGVIEIDGKKLLTACQAAYLADNTNDHNEELVYTINRECTRLRDENNESGLLFYILENITAYSEKFGKYELKIVFTDGKLLDHKIREILEKQLKYKVSIDKMSIKRNDGVEEVYFVNVISWSNPK